MHMFIQCLETSEDYHIYGFTYTDNNVKEFFIVMEQCIEWEGLPDNYSMTKNKTISALLAIVREED